MIKGSFKTEIMRGTLFHYFGMRICNAILVNFSGVLVKFHGFWYNFGDSGKFAKCLDMYPAVCKPTGI